MPAARIIMLLSLFSNGRFVNLQKEAEGLIGDAGMQKLAALGNEKVLSIVGEAIRVCRPQRVTVFADGPEDAPYMRQRAMLYREEMTLGMRGHTVHFDGPFDQGRDNAATKYLVAPQKPLGKRFNQIKREEGLKEIFALLEGSMEEKEMFVKFCCLCPPGSQFALPAMQVTDSAYVVHSEDILYYPGYEQFKRLKGSGDFFHFMHSAGRLEHNVSADVAGKRIYIDLEEQRVMSVNTQYAGNSVGLKKLALRLAISKAAEGDWLAEHMFTMGVNFPEGEKHYFMGAFPSACGKTSTAMIPGQTIVGDDIAYVRNVGGKAYAANVERGIFGIITDVNPTDDPIIYKVLRSPREVIFSNVLDVDGVPYWLGVGHELAKKGINYAGDWFEGKKDAQGSTIPPAHKNARYTVRISELANADALASDAGGIPISAIIYGGRDSGTNVPVRQSFSWEHGVFMGASLESETTSATIGREGVMRFDPMANMDFVAVPLGEYIRKHLDFGKALGQPPAIFAVNYFLKDSGSGAYLNGKVDKKAWLLWMAGRISGKYSAIKTPVGFIPKYKDISELFSSQLGKGYGEEQYNGQFSIRTGKLLEKLARIEAIYRAEENAPQELFTQINEERKRLMQAEREFGGKAIAPSAFV